MMNSTPNVTTWLDIPQDCRMNIQFTGDLDIQLTLGDRHDGQILLFARPAMERLAELVVKILSVPLSADQDADLPAFDSPAT